MNSYAVVITYQFENEETQSLILDTIYDTNVSTSSRITEQPIVSGDMIADHMFKEPLSMTIRGVVSLHGSSQLLVSGYGNKLANVQDLFEKIKNSGTLCDIVKLSSIDNDIKFLRRQNMALQNIAWVEKINSLEFTLTFRQVFAVNVNEYAVDISDSFLPSVTEPETLSFTDTLLDWEKVDKQLVGILFDADLLTEDFLSMLSTFSTAALVGIGVALLTAKIIGVVTAALASVGPAGWIAWAIGAAVAVIGATIIEIIKIVKKSKYRISQFKKYEEDRKNQAEVVRFSNFVGEIHTQLSQLNNSIKLYGISADENQECMLTIGNQYYIFKFTKNNTSDTYGLKVFDVDNVEVKVMPDVKGALTNISQCTSTNYLFRAYESGEYVYLMNASEESEKNDLSTYMILVSQINLEELTKLIHDIIVNAILK